MIDTLAIATDGYICGKEIDTLAISSQGYLCIILKGIIILPKPKRTNEIVFPIDGDIQIFIQKTFTKTKIE